MFDPVVNDPKADAIFGANLADIEGPVRRRWSGNAMLVTDPSYHVGGKKFTSRAHQSLAVEPRSDLFVIALFRHGADFGDKKVGIADRFWVVRPLLNRDCFRRSTLPADLQVQQLGLLVLDDGNIADQQPEDALAIASRGCWRLPQSREVVTEL